MKKIIAILLMVSIVTSVITACNASDITTTNRNSEINLPSNPTDEDYLQYIYEVYSSYYDSEQNFNHKNCVSRVNQKSVDKNVPETKKVMLNNVEFELQYNCTHYNPFFDRTLYLYTDEGKNVRITLTKDGEIAEILHEFDVIDIENRATPEEVLPRLKEKLEDYIDMSKYSNVKMPNDNSDNENGFGTYDFIFYNSVEGYMTDYIQVRVKEKGQICTLRIHNWDKKFTSLNIDENLVEKMLELKFKDIYTTDTTEYISYKLDERDIPQIIIREGITYVAYAGSARLLLKSTDTEINSYVTEILIPLEIISNKA